MPCKCKKKIEDAAAATLSPEDSCVICAQKHFTQARRAMCEFGYELNEDTHDFAIGELGLAICHVREDYPDLAMIIREIRHYIQYWKYAEIGDRWQNASAEINRIIRKDLNIEIPTPGSGKIYVFSNVKYPEAKKIKVRPGDILVFLNKSESIGYYRTDSCAKFAFHRSQDENYGAPVPGCINRYVFDRTKSGIGLKNEFIDRLKKNYDWNYEIEKGKVKSMTTGYMVVKWLEETYKHRKIVLVNFGFEVKNSTYRCPWHNWKFEAEELKKFEHIYTAETEK